MSSSSTLRADTRAVDAADRDVYGRRFHLPRDLGLVIVLGMLGFITFIPVLMLLQLSFKTEQQMATAMWLPAWPLHLDNYARAFVAMSPYLINGAIFVIGTVAISVACATLTAYALARYDFPGREFAYLAILALLMIPGILTLFPTFIIVVKMHLNNTFWGIWLPLAAGSQAFQVIVMRTFLSSIPEDLFEAARLDGAGELRMLTAIGLPLAVPILTTLVVLQTNAVWNEYVWPIMVLSRPEQYPATLIIMRLGNLITARDIGGQYAAYVLAGVPMLILFALASRAFIRGLTSGALKL